VQEWVIDIAGHGQNTAAAVRPDESPVDRRKKTVVDDWKRDGLNTRRAGRRIFSFAASSQQNSRQQGYDPDCEFH
jgi:hypothetical protein